MFGICLGHQLLATALGAETYKLPFGHHGGNHPVRHLADGTVEITSQNHNYAVDDGSLAKGVEVTHLNLNDGVVEGLRCTDVPAFSVQYHPEAGPGPHDAAYLFDLFDDLMDDFGKRHPLMPRRDDIASILLIGSGPIVIGQACEFDYSGTQACRVLREEGYRVDPRQLEPGDDHDRPRLRRRHLRRAPRRRGARAHHRAGEARRPAAHARRPDRAQPGHGAGRERRARPPRRRAHRRQRRGHRHRRGPRAVQAGHGRDRPRRPAVGHRPHPRRGRGHRRGHRPARGHPPRLHPRRPGHRHRRDHRGVPSHGGHRPRGQPHHRDPDREVDRRAGRSTSSRSCATAPTTA